jgi:hypothetical protein
MVPASLAPALSRRQFLATAGTTGAVVLLPALPEASVAARRRDSVVLEWNAAFLQGVRDSKLGPPMVARALAIGHTCIYDAWSAYDHSAVGTRLGGALRRPARERTTANIRQAVSVAAHRAAVDLFPATSASVFDPLMRRLGYDPADRSTDAATPAGIGNLAARAVLLFHHRDGANQLGDEPGGAPGVPYADYTGYRPVNAPLDTRLPFDPSTVRDPNAWQPLRYVDGTGALVTQGFVGAQWQQVKPFAVRPGSLRSPSGPARFGSREYVTQARELLRLSARLTDEHKVIAEYWADGPKSELPPGHWDLFAQYVSRRDRHGDGARGIKRDVKLFFALTNAIMDAGCCAWDNKCAYNSVRPITAIRTLFAGRRVRAWAGPLQGTRLIDGATWIPYQQSTFPTPPFPEYSSGHSCFSAAGAEVIRRFTGSDRLGASVTIPAGSSAFEPGAVPAEDVTLRWATLSEAADQAGLSRRYGGIHFEQGDLDARAAGKIAARVAWRRARALWHGR